MKTETTFPTDQQLKDWADRHNMDGWSLTDLRCAFEDAASLCMTDNKRSNEVLTAPEMEELLPSEIAQRLGQILETYPASEQHTKCSILITRVRQELELYQDTRPMTEREKTQIANSWKKLNA